MYAVAAAYVDDAHSETTISRGIDDVTEHHLFEIGSLSKLAATTLAALLLRDVVRLDMTIGDFFGDVPSSSVTVEQLATHESGLPRLPPDLTGRAGFRPNDPYAHFDADALEDTLGTVEPGDPSVGYSNLGFIVLARILELASNKPFAVLAKEAIFEPLGMRDASVGSIAGHPMAMPPYRDNRRSSYWDHPTPGAGGVSASLADMARFARANAVPAVSPLRAELAVVHERCGTGQPPLAWQRRSRVRWHNGATGGFSGLLGVDQETERAIVILTNRGGPSRPVDAAGFRALGVTS